MKLNSHSALPGYAVFKDQSENILIKKRPQSANIIEFLNCKKERRNNSRHEADGGLKI